MLKSVKSILSIKQVPALSNMEALRCSVDSKSKGGGEAACTSVASPVRAIKMVLPAMEAFRNNVPTKRSRRRDARHGSVKVITQVPMEPESLVPLVLYMEQTVLSLLRLL